MDHFLDSVEPDFSDSEYDLRPQNRLVKLDSTSPKRSVSRVIVASHPDSIVLDEILVQTGAPSSPITSASGPVGTLYYVGNDAVISFNNSVTRFALCDLIDDYTHLVVLASQMYRTNMCAILSTDAKLTTAPRDLAIDSMAAFLLTEAIKSGKQASAVVNLHTSIRAEFDGLWNLWETISHTILQGWPRIDPRVVANRFRKECPLNKKIPLYS
jgi:hypothetical protein